MVDVGERGRKPVQGEALAESLGSVMGRLDERVRQGDIEDFLPIPTGFDELDMAIGGGFRRGQLILLSGSAGIGKTSLAMQMARNIAAEHRAVCLFACYEHETDYLAQRLVSMESVGEGGDNLGDGLRLRDISDLVQLQRDNFPKNSGFVTAVRRDPRGARALERIARYSGNLLLIKGSSFSTNVAALAGEVNRVRAAQGANREAAVVLFVDYLQKVAATTPHTQEEVRNVEALEALKELALQEGIVIVAILASQIEGLKARRMRLENLLTSAELAYEADIVMVMNEKFNVVDRHHIDYNQYNAQLFHQYVILSLEKNRMGSDLVELQLRKQLQFCRFRDSAERVKESMITGRPQE
jgi:replicative DNA helicase